MHNNTSVPVMTVHQNQVGNFRKTWKFMSTRMATAIAMAAAFVTIQATGAFAAPNPAPTPTPTLGGNGPVDPTVYHAGQVLQATFLYGGGVLGLVLLGSSFAVMALTEKAKLGKRMMWGGIALIILCGGPAVIISIVQSGGQNALH